MPQIPENIISAVFYLYANAEDAKAGRDPGGTGFIVAYEGTIAHKVRGSHFYAVTNWHVVCGGDEGCPVIRLNTQDGGVDIIDLDCSEWEFIPGKFDVAVYPLNIDARIHKVSAIPTFLFAMDPYSPYPIGYNIGVGEDAFMLGLFVDHAGITTNIPSARFGNISMLPSAKAVIEQPTGYKGINYILDMHSRSGFSGSPVFVYRTFGSNLNPSINGESFDAIELDINEASIDPSSFWSGRNTFSGRVRGGRGAIRTRNLFKFLGIHWGQFPESWELRDRKHLTKESRRGLIADGAYIEGLSGMTCVIPAWNVMEVLDMPKLAKLREPSIAAADDAGQRAPRPEANAKAENNSSHKEDFNSLLNAAAKTKPQGD
jgi:hypothetical protein